MKKYIFKLSFIALAAIALSSCKGDAKNETNASEAKEVASAAVDALKFKVNPEASSIMWAGYKPTGSHNGTINIESGVVKVAGDKITGTFLIDMKSITVTDLEPGDGKESLEAHLKGTAKEKEDHFFNVAKYPTAAFEVTGVTMKDGKSMMQGNLTMRGIKKNIEFPVTYAINGNMMTLTSETFTIDRTAWGVNYGSKSVFDNLGDKFINDDMEITVKLTAEKG